MTPDPTIAVSIHRADVADLVCRCLFSSQADYKVLSAVDRQITYGQTDFEVLPLPSCPIKGMQPQG
ncbi:MAG: hypothetical protein SFY66_00505 [Oculatellaceae cyanobacterium bins.114]|nr:hypothetical protein [Oculatellaceae cyanobacterium bins.114]